MAARVRAVLTMVVPVERAESFEQDWRSVADWVRRNPDCLRQTLSRAPCDDAGDAAYVITSDWCDLAAYRRFEASSQQDDATARLRALRRSASMQILRIVEHTEGS
jgi:heme-degrading monooxygenase HmoA